MSVNPRNRQLDMPPLQRMTLTSPRGSASEGSSLMVTLGATGRRHSPGVIGGPGASTPVVGSSPTRKIGKLKRRETTGRLLDLAKPTSSHGILKSPVGTKSLPDHLTSSVQPAPSPSSRPVGWKSSKLFARTMTSSDLLKGLKKTPPPAPPGDEEQSAATAVKATFMTRLSSIRRKASGGEVVIKVESEDASPPSEEAARGPLSTPPRKKSEDEGIVCKKEDLISLIRKAAKKQAAINKAEAAEKQKALLTLTRSTSLERTDQSGTSESTNAPVHKDLPLKSCLERSPSPQPKSPMAKSPMAKTSPVSFETVLEQEEEKKMTNTPIITVEEEDEEEEKEVVRDPKRKSSNVEWDDNSVVDAMLLGGAIEAFLKGSMSGSEKRVSFKKN